MTVIAPLPPETPASKAARGELPLVLPLIRGGEARVKLAYELAGPADAPLLIVAGGISAGRHVAASGSFPEAGWWERQSPALAGWRWLAIDWVDGDGRIDRPIEPADQASALVRLLDHLHEPEAAAFIGASYGAMVGMQLAACHPRRVGALLAISAAGRAHPFASACRALQRRAIRFGEAIGDEAAGVALARAMAMLTYRTPQEFAERFSGEPVIDGGGRLRVAAEEYLDAHGDKHCRRMSAAAYRRLSESIDLHRIDPKSLKLPVTFAGADTDALVPAADTRALAAAIPGARFHLIQSRFGHDAFLKEQAQVGAIVTRFLESLELSR